MCREHFWDLGTKFAAERDQVEKDIAEFIPVEKLHEFNKRADAMDDDDDGAGYSNSRSDFNAGSPEQIARLLYEILKVDEGLKIKKTASGKMSTGKRQLEQARLKHPVVPMVLRHRELAKLKNTYCDSLPKLARFHPRGSCCPVCELPHKTDQWRVHGELGTTRAETGRINHKNPNLGNIPTRTEDGQAVQAGFVAPPGTRIVTRDLSQIELRGLAHLSNCKSMIDVYLADGDIHTDTCYRTGMVPVGEKPDKYKHRMAAKRVNFGIQNGTTEKGLYLQLVMDFGSSKMPVPDWLTEDWCKKFIEDWLDSRPEVRAYFDLQHYRAIRYGMVWESFGRVRLVPEMASCHHWIKDAGKRQAQNMPVTSIAAAQLKLSIGKTEEMLLELWDGGYGPWVWPLMTIHDSIMVEADEEVAEDVGEMLGVAMDGCMTDEQTGELRFRVPIKSDGSVMERWEKG